MTLHEYIKSRPSGAEVTVLDKEYDMESYFYNDKPEDKWDMAIEDLSKLVSVTQVVRDNVVEVDFSGLIEKNLDNIKKTGLFFRCTLNHVMGCLPDMISGYISEEWFVKFVEALK